MNLIARKQKRVLVLSPHADDAEIGCGGYIARTVAEGGVVMVALATVGDIRFLHLKDTVSVRVRLEEFENSMQALGVQQHRILSSGYDSTLNNYPMGQMVAQLDELQEEFKPDEVLLPLPSSHQDHKYCWEVGIAATRPSPAKHSPSVVAAYEYPQSFWGTSNPVGQGGVYVDVSAYWAKKIVALSCYATQMRNGHSLIGLAGVEALATLRGVECGVSKAELLHALRITVK